MRLFDRFDKAYLINLDKREDRLENFKKEVNKYNLGDFQRVSAYDGEKLIKSEKNSRLKSGAAGLILSNLEIIRDAIKNNYDKILIMEDDCIFTNEVLNVESYFEFLPNDWDLLYMGGNHNTHMGYKPPTKINDKIVKLHNTFSAHFVGIKKTMFNIIERSLSNLHVPIDVLYSNLQKEYNAYSFTPAIAHQMEGFSDIEKTNVNYKWLIK